MSNHFYEVNGKPMDKGEKIFVTVCLIIFSPFVLLGVLFDAVTKHRTLYVNVNKPWEMHLGEDDENPNK